MKTVINVETTIQSPVDVVWGYWATPFHILHFDISINADVEKVFQTMLAERNYLEWTSVFNPSSRFEGSWNKGSKILFLGTEQEVEHAWNKMLKVGSFG